jgi:hypothetical protein
MILEELQPFCVGEKMSNVKIGAEAWDERFSGDGWAYGREPNVWLAERISMLSPGKALFPADGEGRNAVWAATKGWESYVFDLSSVGKKKCAILASEHDVTVHYKIDDLETRQFNEEEFDLVACSWFHVPSTTRIEHYPRMLKSIKSGGHFVTEGYHKTQIDMTSGGPKDLDLLWDLDELIDELGEGFEIVHAAVEETILEESELHSGLAQVVRLHLMKVDD